MGPLPMKDRKQKPAAVPGLGDTDVAEFRKAAHEEALALVGLAGEAHKLPAETSGGQQQRVTIARALVNEPAIVWADEPTGNLDSENSAEVVDLLCRLNKEKSQTFVLVTHDIAVGRKTDRILRMADGEIVEELHVGGG